MSELWQLFQQSRGRLCEKWAHYFPIYERHFARFQNATCTVLEIGCGQGGSLQLWKKYFGPGACVVGLDINPKCSALEEPQISVCIGDQSDTRFLTSVIEKHGPPDIVIDDGSHMQEHVLASFDFLYPLVDKRGLYLVEDLHTAYWSEFGGASIKETFIDRTKDMIDDLNAYHTRGVIERSEFTRTTSSIHVYDSIVVFEKSPHPAPSKVISGCFGEWRGVGG